MASLIPTLATSPVRLNFETAKNVIFRFSQCAQIVGQTYQVYSEGYSHDTSVIFNLKTRSFWVSHCAHIVGQT